MRITTQVFFDGNSQVVIIPEEFRLDCSEVIISSDGHTLTLTPHTSWVDFFKDEGSAPTDFMKFDRNDAPQVRDILIQ